jgi:glycosyltransferase 2 family protein
MDDVKSGPEIGGESPRKPWLRRVIRPFLQYALGFGLLAWVIWAHWHLETPDGEDVGLATALARPIYVPALLAAGAFCASAILVTFYRWYRLVVAQELPFTLRDAIRLGLIGYYFNTYLPGSIGGDLIKAAFLAREQQRRTVAVATVLVDRVIGLAGLYCLAVLVGGPLWAAGRFAALEADATAALLLRTVFATAFGVVLFLGLGGLIFCSLPDSWAERGAERLSGVPRIGGILAEVWWALWMYRRKVRVLGVALLLAIVSHSFLVLAFYSAAMTITPAEQLPPLDAHFAIVPAGLTIQASFPAPGGVGGGEYGFGLLYRALGFTFAAGVLGCLGFRGVTWILGLLGYLVYLRLPRDGT